MALSKTFEFRGLTVNDGYLKITEYSGNKSQMKFVLAYKASSSEDAIDYQSFNFTPDLNGDNFIRQAYLYLKTLPNFANAEDV